MNEKKRIPFVFTLLDYKAMEEYFELQASKGWMLEKINSFTMEFTRTEPKDIKFSVDVFPYINIFDSYKSRTILDYRDLCEQSGWTFITSSNKLQVFYTEDKGLSIPLQTDTAEEERIIKKAFLSPEVLMMFILFPILFLSLGGLFPPRYDQLFLNSRIASMIIMPLLLIPVSIYVIYYGVWFWKAKSNVREGLSLPRTSIKSAVFRGRLVYIICGLALIIYILATIADAMSGQPFFLIFLIIPAGGIGIGLWFRNRGLKAKRSRGKNILIFIVLIISFVGIFNFFVFRNIKDNDNDGYSRQLFGINSQVPEGFHVLKLSNFGLDENPSTKAFQRRSTVVVPKSYDYHEISTEGTIRTYYYESINNEVSEHIFEGMLDREGSLLNRSVSETKASDWRVDRAYYLKDDKSMILLLKGNAVTILEGELDFSKDEVIDVSMEQLGI